MRSASSSPLGSLRPAGLLLGLAAGLAVLVAVAAGGHRASATEAGISIGITEIEVGENNTVVTTPLALATDPFSDPLEQPLTWSITGAGADDPGFEFSSGEAVSPDGQSCTTSVGDCVLSFVAAPDYENPADADGDNLYEVELHVAETGEERTGTDTVTVTVTDTTNFIVMMADDMGYETVGAYGGVSYQTPVLDGLAATGMRFDQGHAQPLCSPTRVKLLTGRYNFRNFDAVARLNQGETTIANRLRDAGYRTASIGKWQLQYHGGQHPPEAGFDEFIRWWPTRATPSRYWDPIIDDNGAGRQVIEGAFGPDVFNDYARDFIDRHTGTPFFIYYPMVLVHLPLTSTPDHPDASTPEEMQAAMVAYTDKMVGNIVAKLDETNLRNDTLLIFTADNGTAQGIYSELADGTIIEGGKGLLTDAGTRVPFIANWPGTVPAGVVNPHPVEFTTFFQTYAELAGVTLTEQRDGHSIAAELRGDFSGAPGWIYMYLDGPFSSPNVETGEFTRTARYKLYRTGEFYDVAADPLEESPIPESEATAEHLEVWAQLQDLMDGVRSPPVAVDDAGEGFTTAEDVPFTTASVAANDTDRQDGTVAGATVQLVGTPPLGLVDNGDGTFHFTPLADFNGQVSFEYTVADAEGWVSNVARVTLTVTPAMDHDSEVLTTAAGEEAVAVLLDTPSMLVSPTKVRTRRIADGSPVATVAFPELEPVDLEIIPNPGGEPRLAVLGVRKGRIEVHVRDLVTGELVGEAWFGRRLSALDLEVNDGNLAVLGTDVQTGRIVVVTRTLANAPAGTAGYGSKDYGLDLEVFEGHLAVLGRHSSGKGRVLVRTGRDGFVAKIPYAVVDPVDLETGPGELVILGRDAAGAPAAESRGLDLTQLGLASFGSERTALDLALDGDAMVLLGARTVDGSVEAEARSKAGDVTGAATFGDLAAATNLEVAGAGYAALGSGASPIRVQVATPAGTPVITIVYR